MKPIVVIPFAGKDELRLRNLGMVVDFYQDNFPDWPRTIAHSLLPFNRAAALNKTIGQVEQQKRVVVLNDADTLCTPEQVRSAVALATVEPYFVFAYTLYLRLGEKVTAECETWRDVLAAPAEWGMVNAGSQGCSAVQRGVYLQLGGLDERFDGCGYEDLEFNMRTDKAGLSRRLPGGLGHFWPAAGRGNALA